MIAFIYISPDLSSIQILSSLINIEKNTYIIKISKDEFKERHLTSVSLSPNLGKLHFCMKTFKFFLHGSHHFHAIHIQKLKSQTIIIYSLYMKMFAKYTEKLQWKKNICFKLFLFFCKNHAHFRYFLWNK